MLLLEVVSGDESDIYEDCDKETEITSVLNRVYGMNCRVNGTRRVYGPAHFLDSSLVK